MLEFDQLAEQAGVPLRINHVNVGAGAALAAVEVARQPDLEWYVWLLRALYSHSDKTFERNFSRIGVARIPIATASPLIWTVKVAVSFWIQRYKDAHGPEMRNDWSCAHDALRLSLMTLSRITVHMTADEALNTLHRVIEAVHDPQIVLPFGLVEAWGELAKQAIKAIPQKQRGAVVLSVLEFPLPSEKSGQHYPTWPKLILNIWNVRPDREPTEKRWDLRIEKLIAAVQKGSPDRQLAILQLSYLSIHDLLTPNETAAFGKALWSNVGEDGLPAETGLNQGIFQKLPTVDGVDASSRVAAWLLGTKLPEEMRLVAPTSTTEMQAKLDRVVGISNAARYGFVIPPDRAARMFEEIVTWQLQQVRDGRDPLTLSFAKTFNQNIAASAGYLLTTVLVPAFEREERTEGRARDLLSFITRTCSWPSLRALPYFLPASAELEGDVLSAIRSGLLGSDEPRVSNAALAIVAWAKLVREGVLSKLPRSLLERLIGAIEARRAIGLSAMIDAVRALVELGFLDEDDLKRMKETISEIRQEVRYENVSLDTMDAVSAPLVRASCVKLAVALKARAVDDDGAIQAWIDEASTDPLPEVRFSLNEPFEEDTA